MKYLLIVVAILSFGLACQPDSSTTYLPSPADTVYVPAPAWLHLHDSCLVIITYDGGSEIDSACAWLKWMEDDSIAGCHTLGVMRFNRTRECWQSIKWQFPF